MKSKETEKLGWEVYSLDTKPVNYEDLSKNQIIIATVKKKPEISANLKIGDKIYSVSMLDFEKQHIGVHEFKFVDSEEIEETLEGEFTCPYCGCVDYDAFEMSDEGECKCPRCNSELKYERQVSIQYMVTPIKKAKVIKVSK